MNEYIDNSYLCAEIMKDIIREVEGKDSRLIAIKDISLLERHAAPLFKHLKDEDEIEAATRTLIQRLSWFRNGNNLPNMIDSLQSQYRSKHNLEDNTKAMQDKARDLVNLMGGDTIGTIDGTKAKKILYEIINKPDLYILPHVKFKKSRPSKQAILDHLISVKTPYSARDTFQALLEN